MNCSNASQQSVLVQDELAVECEIMQSCDDRSQAITHKEAA